MTYGLTHASKKISTTVFVVIRAVRTARVSFEGQYVISMTRSFPFVVLESEYMMSIATSFMVVLPGTGDSDVFISRFCFSWHSFCNY